MHHTNLALKYTAALCLLILIASSVKAQNLASAKILTSSGSVQITRPTGGVMNRVKLRGGDELFAGDVIKTGMDGRLVIGLKDGSQAIIISGTIVEIKDANNSPRTIFNVLRGKTRIKIEKLGGKPNPYRITTPTTVIAVRGTIFDVFVKKEETKVFVVEGEVSVALLAVPDIEVILTPGQFTRVRENEPPQTPAPFKLKQNDDVFSLVSKAREGRGIFDNPSQDNPGRGGFPDNFPGNAPRNVPGGSPGNNPNVPANPGNSGRRGRP
jgi:hypothetical protein